MRFHVVSLPHTVTSKAFTSCAYTQKVLNFCKMMHSLGHEVIHYGGEGSDVPCTEHVTTVTSKQRSAWWGSNDTSREFYRIEWDPRIDYWMAANGAAIRAIATRIQPRDFLCFIGGACQKPIADAFPVHQAVEYGIGYEGTFAPYRVFESYAHMHYLYGKQGQQDGRYYDEVIGNYYDPADFPGPREPKDYFLFVGRLIERKGLHVAAMVAAERGARLLVAGQGVVEHGPGYVKAECGWTFEAPYLEYVGTVGVEERARLMGEARALFVPTQYIGPFEGVHAEALLCGTPVITTDWGCFAETVLDGVDGFRTRSLGEMIWAAKECAKLDRATIRERALARWSIDVVRHRYQAFFDRVGSLWDPGGGWNSLVYDPTEKRVLGRWS